MQYKVVAIPIRHAIDVRHAAYYPCDPSAPLMKARLDCDGDLLTSHFGIYDRGICVAAGSLTADAPSPRRTHERAFRLRGMAVLPARQGEGLGAAVLDYAIERVGDAGGGLVWANIRVGKTGFYEKWGFAISPDTFLVREGSPLHHYGDLELP